VTKNVELKAQESGDSGDMAIFAILLLGECAGQFSLLMLRRSGGSCKQFVYDIE
jgi:hypothetical protein